MSFWRLAVMVGSVAMIIVATLLPFGGMPASQIPPRWCVRCGGLWMTDAISNVALFVPFGIALALRGWRWWRVMMAALLCSVFVEGMQAVGLPPGRSAAVADLVTNTIGGLVGAALMAAWRSQRGVAARTATWLTWGWSLVVMGVFTVSTMALGPRSSVTSNDAFTTTFSPLRHVPGLQWYEGITDSAFIDARHVSRGWSGPIIQQANREALPLRAGVTVRQNDPLPGRIPLLFVHLPKDSAALLMIAKHGNDAELVVTRRAWNWGLALPVATVPNAFANRSLQDPRTLTVTATVTSDALRLESQGAFSDVGIVRLTPLLGWALIQTVISVHSPLAPLMMVGWLFVLLAPLGWWSVMSGRLWIGGSAGLCVLGFVVMLPQWTGVHALSLAELLLAGCCLAAGALLALVHRTRQLRLAVRR